LAAPYQSGRIDRAHAKITDANREEALKPAPFAYAKARSVAHAIDLLAEDEARLLAGGQSLVATLNMRLDRPHLLVDINGIPGLDGIALKDGHVEIGALVRHAQAERSAEISSHAPLIASALPHIGHPAIRNRGTIGGSIAFADPAAELPACLVALGGEMEIVGPQGPHTVKADDFFTALFETALGPRDVLTLMRIPAACAQTRIGFAELARRHGDYAMVGLAGCARADGERLADIRLVYFGVGPIPVRARSAETALCGGDLEGAVGALRADLHPDDDVQATAAVKTHLAGVLLRRVARQLMAAPGLPRSVPAHSLSHASLER
jgi:carbon-monoxide dehydrogenase medium subunit